MSNITIIGTGEMAGAIGDLAARAGHLVEIVGRDVAKARALSEHIGKAATTEAFGKKPSSGLVILAVPYSAVVDALQQYGEGLADKILVDITNPIKADLSGFLTSDDTFGAREIERVAPGSAKVIKAFNTQNARVLSAGPLDGHLLDIFIAGDDERAKAQVKTFIASLGLRPMDVGPLPMARTLEHACMLWLGLMSHCVKHGNFSIGVRLLD